MLLLSVLTKGVVDNGGNLLPASLTRVAIRGRCRPAIEVNLGKDVTTIVADTGGKFAAGINDTGGQLAVLLILFAHLIFANMQNNSKWPKWDNQELGKSLIHEKKT